MSEALNSIVGKQNDFATRFMGGGSTSATGDGVPIVTLTPPAGQRVRLTHLSTAAGTTRPSLKLAFDALDITITFTLDGDDPSSNWTVGSYQDYTAGNPPSGNHLFFTGDVDEVFYIISTAGAATGTIYYGYEFGE